MKKRSSPNKERRSGSWSSGIVVLLAVAVLPAGLMADVPDTSATEDTATGQEEAVEERDEERADKPIFLGTVDVETTQADRSQSVSVITRDETDGMHFTNINDALFSGTPGVAVSRGHDLGFGGPNSGFLIRGLQGPHVAVFVDGIPIQVNNHFHSRVDRYSSDLIDRMEITRGPSVLKHGASAVAGVIDIYTRKPGKGLSGFIQGSHGRYDTTEIFGDLGYGWDTGSVLFSGSDRYTQGPTTPGGTFASEAHDLTNYNFKLNQTLNDLWSLGLRSSHAVEDPDDYKDFAPGVTYRRFEQSETDFVFHLDRNTTTSNTLIAVHDNTLDNSNARYIDGVEIAGSARPRKEDEIGILARHTWLRTGGNRTTVGFSAVEYGDDRFRGTAEKDETQFYSAYLQASQGLTDSIRVNGGVRVTEGEDFGTDISPEIGIVKKINPSLALRARAGKAFRVPRLGDNDADDMPTIDPEDFYHAEVGLNKRFGDGAEFDITTWWMAGDNLIVSVGGFSGFQENTGEFSHNGLEASLKYPITNSLSSYAGYTWASLEEQNPFPQNILDLGLQYRRARFRGNLALRNGRNNARPSLRDDDYTVLDARFEFVVREQLDLFLTVDNVTDTEYLTFDRFGDVPNVRRMPMLGLRWSYGG